MVAEYMRAARRMRGITQQELARKVGIHKMSISRFETGEKMLSRETIERIAAVLDVPAPPPESGVIGSAAAAKLLGVTKAGIHDMVRRGKLPDRRDRRRRLIFVEEDFAGLLPAPDRLEDRNGQSSGRPRDRATRRPLR